MTTESSTIELLEIGICERGNHAFSYPESGKAVMFAKVSNSHYFQASYTPSNYPAWDCSLIAMTDDELEVHIQENLAGWRIDKCQFDGVKTDNSGNVLDLGEEEVEE